MGFSALMLFINKHPLTMVRGQAGREEARVSRGNRVTIKSGVWGHRKGFSPDLFLSLKYTTDSGAINLDMKKTTRILNPRKTHLSKILHDVNIKSKELEKGFKLLKTILAHTPHFHTPLCIFSIFIVLCCWLGTGKKDSRNKVCVGVILFFLFSPPLCFKALPRRHSTVS